MIHISELSWTRIKHPSDVVKVGDTVEVYIKALDRENKKISLGYKRLRTILGRFSSVIIPSEPNVKLRLSDSLHSVRLPTFFPELTALFTFLKLPMSI